MKEFLVLTKYTNWTAGGKQVYGCRGQGKEYQAFWEEMRDIKFVYEHDNWPWSYIALNAEDEKTFLAKYESVLLEYQEETYDSIYDAPPDTRTEEEKQKEKMLCDIFNEELMKEVNKEVINMICKNAKEGTQDVS